MRWLYLSTLAPDLALDFEDYVQCEREVIEPELRRQGYCLRGSWYTGDGDSWGPLSRCIDTDRGTVVYG